MAKEADLGARPCPFPGIRQTADPLSCAPQASSSLGLCSEDAKVTARTAPRLPPRRHPGGQTLGRPESLPLAGSHNLEDCQTFPAEASHPGARGLVPVTPAGILPLALRIMFLSPAGRARTLQGRPSSPGRL